MWKEQDTDFLKDALARYIHDRIPTEQDRNLISLFTPARVMELIRYFVLFDANVKNLPLSAVFCHPGDYQNHPAT